MNASVLLTVASAAEHPLLDFDSTAVIQLGIFAVLTLVASRLLFRPFLKLRDERSAGIEGARAEAQRFSAEADARLADYETKLAQARSRAQEERRKIRSEAAAHEREVTTKAREDSAATLATAKDKVISETEAARKELMPRAESLAAEIASKLLGREVA